jgi:hypothetical protein
MPEQSTTHRHAYLVLAHEDVDMLNILTNRLINTGFVYIHIDRKSPIRIDQVVKHQKVKVTKQIKVNWGGFSIVEATRLLADQALSDGSTRLTLLSGVSYPIVSDTKLKEFAESSIEYVDAGEVDLKTQTRAFRRRFTTRHFSFHLKQDLIGRTIRRLSREFWALMPNIDPNKELGEVKLTLGSQWWSVTSSTYVKAMLFLEQNKRVKTYFKKIECSDESYFGTLFHHVAENHATHGTTYVKWTGGGGPKSIELADIERESQTGYFHFVRKISSLDRKLFGAIDILLKP